MRRMQHILCPFQGNSRGWIKTLSVGILCPALALCLRFFLSSWMSPERAPFLLFFGAVVCAGWIGGLSVGLLATAVWKAGTKSALMSHNRGWIAHFG
jgi:hypothetical protein